MSAPGSARKIARRVNVGHSGEITGIDEVEKVGVLDTLDQVPRIDSSRRKKR